jgi:transposase-like protein
LEKEEMTQTEKEVLKYGKLDEPVVTTKNTSRKTCDCYCPFQDARYGSQIRVHNRRASGWVCTACGTKKS